MTHEDYMGLALEQARMALSEGETPVGAVIVLHGRVIGRGRNRPEALHDPTAHAEILALRDAGAHSENWRLPGAILYATLEPCVMCAAALLHARVATVVFGAYDVRWGGLGSLFDLAHDPRLNHELEVIPRICASESADLLKEFFGRVRKEHAHKAQRRDAREAEGG